MHACSSCGIIKPRADYSKTQLLKGELRRCKECVDRSLTELASVSAAGSSTASDDSVASRYTASRYTNPAKAAQTRLSLFRRTGKLPSLERGGLGLRFTQSLRFRQMQKQLLESYREAGLVRVKDVHKHFDIHLPLQAYRAAGVADSWNDFVSKEEAEEAYDTHEAYGLAQDIDTQWGSIPGGGAYSDSNHFHGPGRYDYD
jgi:hypothetical protein